MRTFTEMTTKNKKLRASLVVIGSSLATSLLGIPGAVFATSTTQSLDNLNLLIHDTVQFVSAGIGVLLVLFLVIAGLRYLTSNGNANTVSQAKLHIWNIVIAIFLYIFGLIILNYISPGGLS